MADPTAAPATAAPATAAPAAAASDEGPVARANLFGAAELRRLADQLGIRPTKTLGQNFVVDANTVRRIVRIAGVDADDVVLEVGPGLGSLTLALLEQARAVVAVEIDPVLAEQLPATAADRAPTLARHLHVRCLDALHLQPEHLADLRDGDGETLPLPTTLVANLPYNVAVPVLLTLLARFPSIRRVLVMVQAEVADRLAAGPGSKTYGAPSAKAAWYGQTRAAGDIPRSVFWPVPNVDSKLVSLVRPADLDRETDGAPSRARVFEVIDAAFAQRRKTLRSALGGWAGSPSRAEDLLRAAGVDPSERGERLAIDSFIAIAAAAEA